MLVGIGNDLLRELDVLGERKVRAVNHDGRETGVNAALASFIAVTVVEVKNDLRLLAAEFLSVFNRALRHVAENRGVGILASTLRDLHNNRRFSFDCRLNDGLHLLHRIEVECRDGIAALDGLSEHLLGINETKFLIADHFWFLLMDF